MAIEIKVPQLPESVADATLVTWHKQAGQAVTRDENLADLETDKVVLEVPAPVNGVLKELKIVAGTSVTSGQVLAVSMSNRERHLDDAFARGDAVWATWSPQAHVVLTH